ncbi:MAG: hypothetical protein QM726_04300 [Chitinophagaceae bacterium]
MKRAMLFLLVAIISCRKQDSINEQLESVNDPGLILHPRLPPIPRIPLTISKCINSYQDIIAALGSNRVTITKVILESGAVIEPGGDISFITYDAIDTQQPNSLFNSKLSVEWRWPSGNWQLSTADVWSLGCGLLPTSSNGGGVMPQYTNIIKGLDTILVNTCFYWSTSMHTGERVDYLYLP